MKRYLVLSDGTVFEGEAFGAEGSCVGELVFTTNMCGYLETLTDPSYYGQIVLQTFPLIGNYGVIPQDFEGSCSLKGYVVREWCHEPSNFRSQGDLDAQLKQWAVPGICGVDTREITRITREQGVMNAVICNEVPEDLNAVKGYSVTDAVSHVTVPLEVLFPAQGEQKFRVVLMDFGAKVNIRRSLSQLGCQVIVVSADTTAEQVLSFLPDGVMLSNGPDDPSENTGVVAEVAKLMGKVPVFGICLGHQLMALSQGGQTTKLKYGHRGGNQPVKDLAQGRTYITSQNHGYAVVSGSVKNGMVRYMNANDGTCEGVDHPGLRAFSVQFHPETCSGPHDTQFLFDRFLALMKGENRYAAG